jgi:hypothetical protein
MTPKQRQMYRQMEQDFLVHLEDGTITAVDQIITQGIKLQQITSGFIKTETGEVVELVEPKKNPIIIDIKHVLENEISGKLIVVAWNNYIIDALLSELRGYNPAVIRGRATMTTNVEDEKRRFNEDPDSRVIVLQQRAAKYGHTLLGSRDHPCNTTYFAQNSYSLDDRSQIEDRNHREGQHWPVTYIDKVMSDLDFSAITALQRKEDVASAIMGFARAKGILPREVA